MAVLELTFRNMSLGKWSKNWSCYRRYYWPHFVVVKHNIYTLLHACSATVQLLHSWAETNKRIPVYIKKKVSLRHNNTDRSIPYSVIHFPLPSHQIIPNFGIIWRYLSWIRMGTVELCPMRDIYENVGIVTGKWIVKSVFLVIVKFHTMSQMSHQTSHLWYFQWGTWIMAYGIFRLGPPLNHSNL